MNQQTASFSGPNEQPKTPLWLWIVFIVVVLAGAGYFSWYYFMGPGKKVESTATTTTPTTTTTKPSTTTTTTPITTTTTTPSTTATADWKTYTNNDLGYELKYPNSWTYKEEKDFVKFNAQANLQKIEQGYQSGAWEVYIQVHPNINQFLKDLSSYNNEKNLEEYLKTRIEQKDPLVISYSKTKIDNTETIMVIGGGHNDNKQVYIEKDNKIYEITDMITSDNPIFDQILSTFQFTK